MYSDFFKLLASRIMPYWKLDMKTLWLLVAHGKDNQEKSKIFDKLVEEHVKNLTKKCLQVGVPSNMRTKYGSNFISLDLYDKRPCIDFRRDLLKTGFDNNYFDFIVCNAILEHVKDPFGCVREIYRIAAPKAKIWVEVPFIQPFHPFKGWSNKIDPFIKPCPKEILTDENHGGDYWRFTPQGILLLMRSFKLLKMYYIDWGGIAFYGEKATKPSGSP